LIALVDPNEVEPSAALGGPGALVKLPNDTGPLPTLKLGTFKKSVMLIPQYIVFDMLSVWVGVEPPPPVPEEP